MRKTIFTLLSGIMIATGLFAQKSDGEFLVLREKYTIGADGRIGLCVDEQNRSWCSSSKDNDQRAVTIECASDLTEPYAMKPEVYSALVDLCADICRRNGKKKLVWIADRDKALAYEVRSDEILLTVHRWFARKSCPGNWLFGKLGDLTQAVNSRLVE